MSEYMLYSLPFTFSSDEQANAIQKTDSSFSVQFNDRPLYIPREAKNCYITVQSSTCWWNFYNVEVNVNDQIDVEYFDGLITIDKTITIEEGLYDIEHLTSEIGRELLANGFPQDLFILVPNEASQKIVIQFNYSGVQLDLSIPRNFSEILGFDERLVPLGGQTTGIQYEKGDTVANFNTIDSVQIHSDLVGLGLKNNDRYTSIISILYIDVPVGSQIVSEPYNPVPIPSPELIGEKRTNINFWITDQNNNRLNTHGENFGCVLLINYYMKAEE